MTPMIVDARGLKCPLPVLRMEKALEKALSGQTVTVLATDPVARIDIPLYCRQHGHTVSVSDGAWLEFSIVKSSG